MKQNKCEEDQIIIDDLWVQNSNDKPSIPHIPFLKTKGIIPSPIYNTFWLFAYKRQEIFFKRKSAESYPWTDDNVLQKYKFTNAYRASDRVSQYLIRNVIYPKGIKYELSPEDVTFRILLFKLFNKIETWEKLEERLGHIDYKTYSYDKYEYVLSEMQSEGDRIYSAAYIMPSCTMFGCKYKHQNNLKLLEHIMSDHFTSKLANAKCLKDVYDLLLGYPSLGRFLAFQYTIDINYSELCDFSEMEYVVAGPGAKSGISKLFTDSNGYSDEYIIELMAENQEIEFLRLGLDFKYLGARKLQLIDCQNIFCETDKYTRVAFPEYNGDGRSRIKQHFSPNLSKPIDYFYPPKWKINEVITCVL